MRATDSSSNTNIANQRFEKSNDRKLTKNTLTLLKKMDAL